MNKIRSTKKYTVLFLILALIVTTVFFSNKKIKNTSGNIKTKDLPVTYIMGSYSINTDDYKELAGDADNIFIAKVDDLINTEYEDMFKRETESKKMEEWGSPYTNYKITVLDNIKGDLIKDKQIPITKSGGIIYDNSAIEVYEDDELPEVGNIYIMYGYTQADGSILVSGPNSNHKLDINNTFKETTNLNDIKPTLNQDDIYKKILIGHENSIKTNRTHKKSIYENK